MLPGVGSLGLLLLLYTFGTLGHEEQQNCANGWSFYSGACYTIVPGEKSPTNEGFSWMSGELYCSQIATQNGPNHDGHLASIHSQEQQKFIDSLVRAKFLDGTLGRSRDFRIGLFLEHNWMTMKAAQQGFGWSDGTPVDYGDLTTSPTFQWYHELYQWYRQHSWESEEFNKEQNMKNCAVIRYGAEDSDAEDAYRLAEHRRQQFASERKPEDEMKELEGGGRWHRGHCFTPETNAKKYFGLVCQSRPRAVFCGGAITMRQEKTNEATRQEERSNEVARQEESPKEEIRQEQRINEPILPEQRGNEAISTEERISEAIIPERINEGLRPEERVKAATTLEQNTENAFEKRIDQATTPERLERRTGDEKRTEQPTEHQRIDQQTVTQERIEQAAAQEKRIYGVITQQ